MRRWYAALMSLEILILLTPWATARAISASGLPEPPCSTSGTPARSTSSSSRSIRSLGRMEAGYSP